MSIDGIRSGTLGAPAPSVNPRVVPPLRRFEEVTSDEVSGIIRTVPSKHCQLDAAPTGLVKRLTNVLSRSSLTWQTFALKAAGFQPHKSKRWCVQ